MMDVKKSETVLLCETCEGYGFVWERVDYTEQEKATCQKCKGVGRLKKVVTTTITPLSVG